MDGTVAMCFLNNTNFWAAFPSCRRALRVREVCKAWNQNAMPPVWSIVKIICDEMRLAKAVLSRMLGLSAYRMKGKESPMLLYEAVQLAEIGKGGFGASLAKRRPPLPKKRKRKTLYYYSSSDSDGDDDDGDRRRPRTYSPIDSEDAARKRREMLHEMLAPEGIAETGFYYDRVVAGYEEPCMDEFRLRHRASATPEGRAIYDKIIMRLRRTNGGYYYSGIHAEALAIFAREVQM